MGSGSSKAVTSAAGAAKRQYPQRIPSHSALNATPSPAPPSKGPAVHPATSGPRDSKDDAISRDAMDSDFARSLRSLGAVQPSPTLSHTSTFVSLQGLGGPQASPSSSTVPALRVTDARSRLAEEAEAEFAAMGRSGFRGREFLDVMLIRQALRLRDAKGMEDGEIEKKLGLKRGLLRKLGTRGVVGDVTAPGTE